MLATKHTVYITEKVLNGVNFEMISLKGTVMYFRLVIFQVINSLDNKCFSMIRVKQKLTFKGRDSGFRHDISDCDLKL